MSQGRTQYNGKSQIPDDIALALFKKSFNLWPVHPDWQRELMNYLVNGWTPGSFHLALFENDLVGAANHTHVANRWEWIVDFMKWLQNNAPHGSWGSPEAVREWLALDPKTRRNMLNRSNPKLMLTEEEVTWAKVGAH
jgi:hypothetical protein